MDLFPEDHEHYKDDGARYLGDAIRTNRVFEYHEAI